MKRIYSQAQTVIIWLGPSPATFETRIAMPYLRPGRAALGPLSGLADTWTADFELGHRAGAVVAHHMLPALSESPWFRRIWVIQEPPAQRRPWSYGHDAVPARLPWHHYRDQGRRHGYRGGREDAGHHAYRGIPVRSPTNPSCRTGKRCTTRCVTTLAGYLPGSVSLLEYPGTSVNAVFEGNTAKCWDLMARYPLQTAMLDGESESERSSIEREVQVFGRRCGLLPRLAG